MKSMLLFFGFLFILSCAPGKKQNTAGVIQVTFNINKPDGDLQPSYQTVIWLEDGDGRYVRTLFVSEFLSYGGYNDSTICPDWSSQADWQHATVEEYDARTQATPPVGAQELVLALDDSLAAATYTVKMQLHLLENYNILYSGRLCVGSAADSTRAEKSFDPAPFAGGENILSNVAFKYVP